MCGIGGILEPPGRRDEDDTRNRVDRMVSALDHRGPDGRGVWIDADAGVALGHRRLAVLDLSPCGAQPMVSACGRWVLSFNGEIYNFRELQRDLESDDCRLRGSSDTEVLLETVARRGLGATLPRLRGMFAFALWDRKQRRLDLVRDRMGEKPLYVARAGRAFLFASEPAAFRYVPDFSPTLDRDAVAALLDRGVVPAPLSIYAEAAQLAPGCRLRVTHDGLGRSVRDLPQTPWWTLADVFERARDEPFRGTEDEAVDLLEETLTEAVHLSTVSDVPVGAFLSGGIDSSTVVALLRKRADRTVRTFSIGFSDGDFDESHHAARVARHLGTEHTELHVTERDALDLVPRLPEIWSEPFADSSQIPTHLLARLTREHVTVALSGDGGDELFGGYGHYAHLNRLRHLARLPRPVLRAGAAVLSRIPAGLSGSSSRAGGGRSLTALSTPEKLRRLGRFLAEAPDPDAMHRRLTTIWKHPEQVVRDASVPPRLAGVVPRPRPAHAVRRAMALDTLTYLPQDILVKVDRAAMAVALETRIPLLDVRVVELAARLPLPLLLEGGHGKRILRRVLHRHVPPELVERPKMGFRIPLHRWLRSELRPWAESLLDARRLETEGVFHPDPIVRRFREHVDGTEDWSAYLWPVLMFEAWRERWGQATMPAA